MPKIVFIFLVSFFFAECLIEDPKNIIIELGGIETEKIGKKGTLVIGSEQKGSTYTITNTNRETCIDAKISNGNGEYSIKCGLWSEGLGYSLYVFCSIGEDINPGDYSVSFDGTQKYTCSDYSVQLSNSKEIKFSKIDKNVIDLYAKSQVIVVIDEQDSYELKFNIVSYNNEKLIFNEHLIIDNCREENNILVCPITKSELEQYVQPSKLEILMSYMNPDNYQKYFTLVARIRLIFNNIEKTDIYVGITKLLVNANEPDVPIAYETNVTDISEMKALFDGFKIPFQYEEGGQVQEEDGRCNFMKYENTALLLVCWMSGGDNFWLKDITNEIIINGYYIKYNFRIQPVNKPDKVEYGQDAGGSFIEWYYPKVLNFKENEGPLYIEYNIESPNSLNGLTFNEEASDLECEKIGRRIKRCKVPKSHFTGKTSGYYFTQHTNHLGKKSISYEAAPVQVIGVEAESSNGYIISLSLIYIILLGIIMI